MRASLECEKGKGEPQSLLEADASTLTSLSVITRMPDQSLSGSAALAFASSSESPSLSAIPRCVVAVSASLHHRRWPDVERSTAVELVGTARAHSRTCKQSWYSLYIIPHFDSYSALLLRICSSRACRSFLPASLELGLLRGGEMSIRYDLNQVLKQESSAEQSMVSCSSVIWRHVKSEREHLQFCLAALHRESSELASLN